MLLAALVISASLNYPIADLGNCDSLSSCRTYCEVPWHQTVCTDYGVRLGVIKPSKVLAAVSVGYPIKELGNCGSKDACKAHCDLPANRPACVNFARAHGIETSVGASEGRAPAERPGGGLAGITFPISDLGNCGSAEECKVYCDLPQNRQPCFNFAYKHGLGGGKKAAEELSGLSFPIPELGNCGSMAECEVYCSQPDHRSACNEYAKARGFEPPKQMAGPGGCGSPEECDAYCSNPAHREECEAAWQEHCAPHPDWPECQKGPGGSGGPGGCTSDEECRAYCESHPDDEACQRGREEWCQKHPEECKEQRGPGGCVSEEECRLYCEQNPNNENCQRGREEWCQQHPDEPECGPREGEGPKGSPNECGGMDCALFCQQNPNDEYCRQKSEEYCQQHPDECRPPEDGNGPPEGGEQRGPGGCQTEEECREYCGDPAHAAECGGGPL